MTSIKFKQIRIRLIDLLDTHKGTFENCKGCKICTEITNLRKLLERDPAEKFKYILAKGQDMTKRDIELLLDNGVQRKHVQKALSMHSYDFTELLRNFKLLKRKTKEEENVAKISFEAYQDFKAQGFTDAAIARELGVKQATLSYYKKQWFSKGEKAIEAVKTVSETPSIPVDKTTEYEAKLAELRAICKEKSLAVLSLEETLQKYQGISEKYEKEILGLKSKVHDLESLHAACDDVESEVETLQLEIDTLREENCALKFFARRYLAM